MKLEFHPAAELELIEAAAYYEEQVPGLGWRFEAEIRRAVDLLLQRPAIGVEADAVLRKFVLIRFPYTLYCSVTNDVLRIEAVAHQRRRPRILARPLIANSSFKADGHRRRWRVACTRGLPSTLGSQDTWCHAISRIAYRLETG